MEKLTIFYDGSCHLCFREVSHYFRKDNKKLLVGIDISSSDFSADEYGLENSEVNLHMHALDESAKVYIGIDCFAEIWKRLPVYNQLAPALESQALRPLLSFGYNTFAKHIRPRLPKRKCDSGTCDI
jgi:predicted DCC family thiol-disulfide oxidoreductase YuxK